jgi:Mechanosensitive ion channel
LWCFLTAGTLAIGAVAQAQSATVSEPPSPEPARPQAAVPAAIPLAEAATEAESASTRLREMQADLSSDRTTEAATEELPVLTREIDAQRRDSANIIAQRPSFEMLDNLEADWHPLRRNLAGWTRDLTSRVSQLEKQIAQLDELDKTWQLTFDAATNSHAPPDLLRNDGSEIIVPNGKLISERLVNWTLSSRQRSIELPIAVAQDSDPSRAIRLLERTAAAHPLVTSDPPPEALVVKLGPDSLGFELRAWTDRIEQWMQIRSELAITISAALTAEKIAIR